MALSPYPDIETRLPFWLALLLALLYLAVIVISTTSFGYFAYYFISKERNVSNKTKEAQKVIYFSMVMQVNLWASKFLSIILGIILIEIKIE